jgi:hypothetical protein
MNFTIALIHYFLYVLVMLAKVAVHSCSRSAQHWAEVVVVAAARDAVERV